MSKRQLQALTTGPTMPKQRAKTCQNMPCRNMLMLSSTQTVFVVLMLHYLNKQRLVRTVFKTPSKQQRSARHPLLVSFSGRAADGGFPHTKDLSSGTSEWAKVFGSQAIRFQDEPIFVVFQPLLERGSFAGAARCAVENN